MKSVFRDSKPKLLIMLQIIKFKFKIFSINTLVYILQIQTNKYDNC